MLDVIALCSCACLACLWCALAYEVARNRRCGGSIFRKPDCRWQCPNCKYACKSMGCHVPASSYRNSCPCLRPSCSTAPCKFVREACCVKPECACAKLLCHGITANHPIKHEPSDASSVRKSSLPNVTAHEKPQPPDHNATCPRCAIFSQNTKESYGEIPNNKVNHTCKQRHSPFKQILRRKRRGRKN